MSNPLFVGNSGMSAIVSEATVNFGVESYMQQQLALIGKVGPNPTPAQMEALANAYVFFSAMWSGNSFTANGVNVNFKDVKGAHVAEDLKKIHKDLDKLFKSYKNVTIPGPYGPMQLCNAKTGKPLTLLDLVAPPPGLMISAHASDTGDQHNCDWYDGDLDDATDHDDCHINGAHNLFFHGDASQSGNLDSSKMPPGFSCHYETGDSGCHPSYDHTSFDLTIDPNAKAAAAGACGTTAGETGMQWLQQHCNVQPDAHSANDLAKFDKDFSSFMD